MKGNDVSSGQVGPQTFFPGEFFYFLLTERLYNWAKSVLLILKKKKKKKKKESSEAI
jgi:hypothetical protein